MTKKNLKTCIGYNDKYQKCENVQVQSDNPYCKTCAGKSFEDDVAKLFKIQGYSVEQGIQCNSTQIDVLAQLNYGMAGIGIIIECKYKFDNKTPVDTADIRSFAGTRDVYNLTTKTQKATQAFLVTTGRITPEAREVGKTLNVELFTYSEMLNKIINFEPYLQFLVRNYESSSVSEHFIDIQTTYGESAIGEIIDFMKYRESEGLLILGDYGSGKSSLASKFCRDLAKKSLAGKNVPIPLLIELKEYSKAFNMEQLITNLFINTYKIPNANFMTLTELINQGKIILVFDGYDEAAKRVDNTVKHQIFAEIIKFASPQSQVIVTCRRNFFNQRKEFDGLIKELYLHVEPSKKRVYFDELELADLEPSQIIEFLESNKKQLLAKNMTVAEMMKIMNNTHDLMDLAKRPVLLQVIVDTISDFELSKDEGKMNAASLYKRYTGFWLMREELKGKTLIRSSEKVMFTRRLALNMFNKNISTIHYSLIPKEITNYFNKLELQEEIDYFSHDIKSCSFLTRNDDGEYSFIHKSFMEYFTAQELLASISDCFKLNGRALVKQLNLTLGGNLINQEVGLFISDLIESKEFDEHIVRSVILNANLKLLDINAFKNAISIMAKVTDDIGQYILQGSDLSFVDLTKAKFGSVKMTDIDFSGASFFKAKFQDTQFEECEFDNSDFRNIIATNTKFVNCQLPYSDFRGGVIQKSLLKDSSFVDTSMEKTRFVKCKAIYCDFSGASSDESTVFDIGTETDTCIGLPY